MPADTDALLARCNFRLSRRARYLRITVSRNGEITVTRPAHVSRGEAIAFARSRHAWIARQLTKIHPPEPATPPAQLQLRLTAETLPVSYVDTPQHVARLREASGQLELHFDHKHPEQGRDLLRQWLKRRARSTLEPHLRTLSTQTSLPCNRLSVRLQRTRWGSCSARRDISLNAKLLFLPEALVRHVLIHELAHTVHLNHSPAFWRLVEQYDPRWRSHRRALHDAAPLIPAWLDQR
ncbi:M48 family metallopeptidase [Acidihalobacter ferrooxydans]|uniref:YgjP-like metallopeptidase domain-containing protein n=1 Tax=Acidihalobacter ferrooxydans TaxID=1765967 RepID=A0A1P8UK12_9GAMM|nr:SprT family zinc-dependent metalloprotease [Acidihalobacter ferrooxydans]APZ44155.1 hypothetical protein BW247_14510 [Acidihalobacter ferrooxydans]